MKIYRILLAIGTISLFYACKKQPESPQPLSRTQLLTGKKWQLRNAVFSYPGSQNIDYYALVPPCTRDDYWQFALPNSLITDEGLTKCSAAYPQTQAGTWEFSSTDTKLTLTDQNFTNAYTILKLTSDSLNMSITVPQSTGVDGIITVSYITIK